MSQNISSNNITLGKGTLIAPSAIIRGVDGNAKHISIGDNCYIGESVQIICDEFSIGDYSKIHHHTNIHGYKPCIIGHNAWIGQYSIIDCIGGATIGNNCGIGAHSQLWSHVKYGDTLEGCRFLSEKQLRIDDDVWFVGHCIVSPVHAKDKSMALVGSVITNDMEYNTIYAGCPAKEISSKIGFQFSDVSIDIKFKKLNEYLKQWNSSATSIKIVLHKQEVNYNDDITYFVVTERKYTKLLSDEEISFMKFLLPEKAKYTPY